MVWVRKVHMYLGLVLFPWVVFFGVSGMLFNHPGVGESVVARPVPAERLRSLTGIEPVEARAVAEDVVAQLRSGGQDYRLDDGFESRFFGGAGFATEGPGVKHLVLVDLAEGRGLVLTRPDRSAPSAPFAGVIELKERDAHALEARLAGLLPSLGVHDARHPPQLSIAPSVRFRMRDADGQVWNATYDLGSGELDGRPASRSPSLSLHDVLGELHKTHHFPPHVSPKTFWVIFADLTALTLIVWAFTGLLMWGQMKRSRVVGAIAVGAGLLVAALTMVATDGELRFGNVRPSEPGGAALRMQPRTP